MTFLEYFLKELLKKEILEVYLENPVKILQVYLKKFLEEFLKIILEKSRENS